MKKYIICFILFISINNILAFDSKVEENYRYSNINNIDVDNKEIEIAILKQKIMFFTWFLSEKQIKEKFVIQKDIDLKFNELYSLKINLLQQKINEQHAKNNIENEKNLKKTWNRLLILLFLWVLIILFNMIFNKKEND